MRRTRWSQPRRGRLRCAIHSVRRTQSRSAMTRRRLKPSTIFEQLLPYAAQQNQRADDRFGSWPCQNAGAGGTRRTLFFFGATSSTALASPLGNCGAGRTRFPSVFALSVFLHGQDHALTTSLATPAPAATSGLPSPTDTLRASREISETRMEITAEHYRSATLSRSWTMMAIARSNA